MQTMDSLSTLIHTTPRLSTRKVHTHEVLVKPPDYHVHYWEDQYKVVIVIPSLSVNEQELKKIKGVSHFEERQLYNLFLLKRGYIDKLIFITSEPLDSVIVDYYFHVMNFEDRSKLECISVHDPSPIPLSKKIISRPRVLKRIYDHLTDTSSCITCFVGTNLEYKIAELLKVPLLAAHPREWWWGTKQGGKEIFLEANVNTPRYFNLVLTEEELIEEIIVFCTTSSNS
eukprot:TRINITY_DN9794_c0_g1_i1.p1 TRINITY_DN9794_c0_g1~~TRINITY_DN9794_c0_g1_i1.p1  ORF type:complete len:228 (+),score=41.47 TRINITY_DN9794_c0_g1_i1:345-1028(+)